MFVQIQRPWHSNNIHDLGTFSLDVTDGQHNMAINITEERFKYLVFHSLRTIRTNTSSNPLAGALLLVTLRVKDMHGAFVNMVKRDIVGEPYVLYQGPFQLMNFKALNVEFVGWSDEVYTLNDVFQPVSRWDIGLETDETLDGYVFDSESMSDDSSNADEESAVAGVVEDSDGDMDVHGGTTLSPPEDSDTESDVDGMDELDFD